ncbi:MAG TPA: EamA family transporter, partial [Candidatus Hodarchaeales archaeon]|nr:EamA family transporter [Candidatus Hodarchaeales archaeon]
MIEEPVFSVFLAMMAAFCWGINAHLIRKGMEGDQDMWMSVVIRSVFSFAPLILLTMLFAGPGLIFLLQFEIFVYILASGILITLGDATFGLGLRRYSVSTMAPIGATYPLFVIAILIIAGIEP